MTGVTTLGWIYSNQILFEGFIDGLIYSLVALGLVLIYRAAGVINFAQGNIGAFGGYVMAILIINYGLPYWLAAPLAIAASGAVSMATELLVVRRLFHQPRLLLFVATLGVAQLVILLTLWLPTVAEFQEYPSMIEGSWDVGPLTIRGSQLAVMIAVPVIMAGLAYLLQRTKLGLAVRSAADNPSAAQLAGVSIRAVSTQVWLLAGLLTGLSTLLIGPVQRLDAGGIGNALGPKLLLFALTAALFGRLQSFGRAVIGGIVVGISSRLVLTNSGEGFFSSWDIGGGADILTIFVLLMLLLLFFGRQRSASSDEAWVLTPRLRAAREDLARHPLYRVMTWGGSALLALIGIGLPWVVDTPSRLNDYASVLIFLLVALSATVLTGWAGQLSLGQFAFAAVGAYFTAYYAGSFSWFAALGLGVLWGVGFAILVGIPALRLKGLFLGVATLGFALVVGSWLLGVGRLNTASGGFGAKIDLPVLFGRYDLQRDKEFYYYLCLAFVFLVLYLVTRLRRSGVGRTLLAVRDNEATASAYTISPTRAKMIAFGLAGGIGALAGGLMTLETGTVSPIQFAPEDSLQVVAVAVVGGISSVYGAILGTILVVGLPTVFDSSPEVRLFGSGLGMLIVLLYFPGGLISLLHNARDLTLAAIAQRTGWTPPAKGQQGTVGSLSSRDRAPSTAAADVPALRTQGVSVSFGGRRAVDDVSIEVAKGEIVGLIGTNGAGKTTFMNAISGFVPSEGRIELFGQQIDGRSSHGRARLGLGRAFQNAKLFGSLTVRETIMTALEARERSLLLPSLTWLPPAPLAERRKRKQAEEIIHYLGLGRYADQLLSELSTGTRRIVELGALIALDTKLMLLDEPTAGVAQKETEAFGPLIRAIKDELGSSILLIEHDMPMVMSISDRIYCLESGGVIAEGDPVEVRNDPRVVASYLGTDERAIARSGEAAPSA